MQLMNYLCPVLSFVVVEDARAVKDHSEAAEVQSATRPGFPGPRRQCGPPVQQHIQRLGAHSTGLDERHVHQLQGQGLVQRREG